MTDYYCPAASAVICAAVSLMEPMPPLLPLMALVMEEAELPCLPEPWQPEQ
jgi:hypothetical protein